jgi:flagella basal body P-ring formation protein FlgA
MPSAYRLGTIITWGLLVALLGGASDSQAADGPQLRITLRDRVRTTDGVLRIKDVARLEGPPKSTLKKWEELDLLDGTEESADEMRITRSLIAARLLLAGCQSDMMTFAGATVTEVERVEPLEQNDAEVERLAQLQVARQLGIAPELVEVRLLGPCVSRLRPLGDDSALGELDVIPPLPRTNDPRITVRWLDGGVVKATLNCSVRIQVSRDWPVAARLLPAGHVLSAEDVVTQPVWCHWTEIAPQPDQYVGKRLKRGLDAEARVTQSDMAAAGSAAGSAGAQAQVAPVIKPRDLIRVSATRGNLTVVLPSAEALQAGRPGDRIRLRNLESQRVITGTVIAAGEVEIQLR